MSKDNPEVTRSKFDIPDLFNAASLKAFKDTLDPKMVKSFLKTAEKLEKKGVLRNTRALMQVVAPNEMMRHLAATSELLIDAKDPLKLAENLLPPDHPEEQPIHGREKRPTTRNSKAHKDRR